MVNETNSGPGIVRFYCPSCRRWSTLTSKPLESSAKVSPGAMYDCGECGQRIRLKMEIVEENDDD